MTDFFTVHQRRTRRDKRDIVRLLLVSAALSWTDDLGYRLLWKLFMSNPEIKPALDKMGFKPDP